MLLTLVCLSGVQKHFNQAANIPFATGLVADKLGHFADNDYCDAILQAQWISKHWQISQKFKI